MNKTPIIVTVTIVVLVLIGALVFWLPKDQTAQTPTNTSSETTQTTDGEVATGGTFSTDLKTVFLASKGAFSLRLPTGYTVDENFKNQITPTQIISGVKFTIPKSTTTGTNLGQDSFISVEQQSNTSACTPFEFTDLKTAPVQTITENNVTYSAITMSDAGAGNRYDTTIYAIPGTNPCTAIRYVIHYSVLENYPAGSVKAFDKVALLRQFDAIRQSVILK